MTKARKVVMAALAGSMLMGSMPSIRAGTAGTVKIGTGLFLVAVGVSAAGGLAGNEAKHLIARIMGAFFAFGGGLLLRDGIGQNEEEKRKKLIDEVRRDVLVSMKGGDSLKNQR